jgi:hypothetical protein
VPAKPTIAIFVETSLVESEAVKASSVEALNTETKAVVALPATAAHTTYDSQHTGASASGLTLLAVTADGPTLPCKLFRVGNSVLPFLQQWQVCLQMDLLGLDSCAAA